MSDSSIIKQHKTSVDDQNEYREYLVYQKDDKFVMECIAWKIKDSNRAGGNREAYQEFKTEKEAVENYNDLISTWEK